MREMRRIRCKDEKISVQVNDDNFIIERSYDEGYIKECLIVSKNVEKTGIHRCVFYRECAGDAIGHDICPDRLNLKLPTELYLGYEQVENKYHIAAYIEMLADIYASNNKFWFQFCGKRISYWLFDRFMFSAGLNIEELLNNKKYQNFVFDTLKANDLERILTASLKDEVQRGDYITNFCVDNGFFYLEDDEEFAANLHNSLLMKFERGVYKYLIGLQDERHKQNILEQIKKLESERAKLLALLETNEQELNRLKRKS